MIESNDDKEKEERKYVKIISPNNINNKEVKARTAFPTTFAMICYIIILCNGDIDLMTDKTSYLIWFEEWFYYFEK